LTAVGKPRRIADFASRASDAALARAFEHVRDAFRRHAPQILFDDVAAIRPCGLGMDLEVGAGVCPRPPAHVGVPFSTSEIATANHVPEIAFDACAFVADRGDEALVLVLEAIGRRWHP
jgi:hypothetical protein